MPYIRLCANASNDDTSCGVMILRRCQQAAEKLTCTRLQRRNAQWCSWLRMIIQLSCMESVIGQAVGGVSCSSPTTVLACWFSCRRGTALLQLACGQARLPPPLSAAAFPSSSSAPPLTSAAAVRAAARILLEHRLARFTSVHAYLVRLRRRKRLSLPLLMCSATSCQLWPVWQAALLRADGCCGRRFDFARLLCSTGRRSAAQWQVDKTHNDDYCISSARDQVWCFHAHHHAHQDGRPTGTRVDIRRARRTHAHKHRDTKHRHTSTGTPSGQREGSRAHKRINEATCK